MNEMENMIKTVCVFSSSSSAVNSVYSDTAVDLGKRLGQEGFDLIFGGADVGLMGYRKNGAEPRSQSYRRDPGAVSREGNRISRS